MAWRADLWSFWCATWHGGPGVVPGSGGSASDISRRRSVNRLGSGQPDEFATRGRCEKRLRENLHRRLSFLFFSFLFVLTLILAPATYRAVCF